MRATLVAVMAMMILLLAAPMAAADPPGATNYQSEVVEIEPPVEGISLEIVGGDSFISLTVAPGIAVAVTGYSGEPYLRFLADGTVEENVKAPSKYVNEDRFGRAELPDGVDAAAPPDWDVVASNGSYAWHDHRTHWMNPIAPPGRGPGDTVAEGVVPLSVDGVEVDVTVASVWQPAPNVVPVVVGFALGLALALSVMRIRSLAPVLLLVLAVAAVVVGGTAYRSVPGETQPPWSLFVFPLVSFLIAVAVSYPKWLGPFGDVVRRQHTVLVVLAALELVAWGILHWSWLWAPVLPTSLPFWLDRLVAASVLVGGAGIAVAALAAARRPSRPSLEAA